MFRRYVRVKPTWFGMYRASYKKYAAFGHTPQEAVARVRKRYNENRFSIRNILNAIGISLLPPFN